MRELGLNPSDAELKDLVSEADLNNDGVISFDGKEFSLLPFPQHQSLTNYTYRVPSPHVSIG